WRVKHDRERDRRQVAEDAWHRVVPVEQEPVRKELEQQEERAPAREEQADGAIEAETLGPRTDRPAPELRDEERHEEVRRPPPERGRKLGRAHEHEASILEEEVS